MSRLNESVKSDNKINEEQIVPVLRVWLTDSSISVETMKTVVSREEQERREDIVAASNDIRMLRGQVVNTNMTVGMILRKSVDINHARENFSESAHCIDGLFWRSDNNLNFDCRTTVADLVTNYRSRVSR